jgi:hypothetical protein
MRRGYLLEVSVYGMDFRVGLEGEIEDLPIRSVEGRGIYRHP